MAENNKMGLGTLKILIFLLLILATQTCRADILFGVGTGYRNIDLAYRARTVNSYSHGPTLLADLRYRSSNSDFSVRNSLKKKLGYDLFLKLGYDILRNVNSSYNESINRTLLGGGIDFLLGHFFFGLQYNYVAANMKTKTLRINFTHPSAVGRLGLNFSLSKAVSLQTGTDFEWGRAVYNNVTPQDFTVTGFSLYALFSFHLTNSEK